MTAAIDNSFAFDLQGVTKSHRIGDTEISILKGINLRIPRGQFVSIIGPSGSGKSTLMYILGCLDSASSGRMAVMGQDVAGLTDDELSDVRCRSMGFVFQGFHLLPSYGALANVSLAMAYSGRKDRWPRARALLQKFGLKHRLLHRPNTLSGGEQQRVAIARAIANDPPILLADEPTGALDQANGRLVLDLLDAFHRQGKTIILVTHDAQVAARAQRTVELVDGQVRRDEKRA